MAESFRQGAVDILSPSGRLDQHQVGELTNQLEPIIHRGQPKIVIDLSHVPLIDSDGLTFLVDMRDLCLRRGGECKLSGANPLCKDILAVSGVDEEMELQSDIVSAAGSFAK